jgi:ankyrin repeat protein
MKKICNYAFILFFVGLSFDLYSLDHQNDISIVLDLESDDNDDDDNLAMPNQIGQMPESPNAFDSFNQENMMTGLNGAQDDFDSSVPEAIKNLRQNTPLMLAVLDNDVDQVRNLLKNEKNNIDEQNKDGQTALHYAAFRNDSQLVRLLLDNKALIDSLDNLGRTPLHFASQNDSFAAAQILVNEKANLTIKDNDDKIPEDYASTQRMQDLLSV